MKRTVTTCVDVPQNGEAAPGRSALRVELTFDAEAPVAPAEAPAQQAAEQAVALPAGKRKGQAEQQPPEPRDALRPTRRRTAQEASAPPPRLSPRQAGEVARRIAAAVGVGATRDGIDPEALLEIAARVAADYLSTMQTLAAGGPQPTLLRVRVGEVGGRTFVDLEP